MIKLNNSKDYIAINEQASSYTLKLSDDSKLIEMNSGNALTLTIPTNTSVPFPIGTALAVRQKGAGKVTIAPFDGSVTVNNTNGLRIIAQYGTVSLLKVATNTWTASGPLET